MKNILKGKIKNSTPQRIANEGLAEWVRFVHFVHHT